MTQLALTLGTDRPLNQAVYAALRGAILTGRVPAGARLPSSRGLAAELRVSRNTVLYAFEQLAAEGYIEARRGAGTFVAAILPPGAPPAPRPVAGTDLRLSMLGARLMRGAPDTTRTVHAAAPVRYDLRAAAPVHDTRTLDAWARALARRARSLARDVSGREPSAGSQALREALASYLARARGLECRPEQVVVTQGSQQAIDLCLRLLVDPGDPVVLEEPHYTGYPRGLRACGADVIHVPVDVNGMQVDGLDDLPPAKLACVTPSHQFPAGGVMPLARRLRLLAWARRNRTTIIEDDYDGEFRYDGRPLESLHRLDDHGRVVYLGSASRVLFSALRIGWAVVPERLVHAFRQLKTITDGDVATLEQLAFADFIRDGGLERHVRRARKRLASRRSALLDALRRELGQRVEVVGASAGIHVSLRLRGLPETAFESLRRACLDYGVGIYSAAGNYFTPPPYVELLVGYASLAEEDIAVAVSKLREALDRLPHH